MKCCGHAPTTTSSRKWPVLYKSGITLPCRSRQTERVYTEWGGGVDPLPSSGSVFIVASPKFHVFKFKYYLVIKKRKCKKSTLKRLAEQLKWLRQAINSLMKWTRKDSQRHKGMRQTEKGQELWTGMFLFVKWMFTALHFTERSLSIGCKLNGDGQAARQAGAGCRKSLFARVLF